MGQVVVVGLDIAKSVFQVHGVVEVVVEPPIWVDGGLRREQASIERFVTTPGCLSLTCCAIQGSG
jgi:hypothetical protein